MSHQLLDMFASSTHSFSSHGLLSLEIPRWWFGRQWPPKGTVLLGGVALLEEMRHWVGEGADFEVSFAQVSLSVTVS